MKYAIIILISFMLLSCGDYSTILEVYKSEDGYEVIYKTENYYSTYIHNEEFKTEHGVRAFIESSNKNLSEFKLETKQE